MGTPTQALNNALGRKDFTQEPARWENAVTHARKWLETSVDTTLIVTEPDRFHYAACAMSAMVAQHPVILANPNWGTEEWAQLHSQLAQTSKLPASTIGIPTGGSTEGLKICLHHLGTLEASAQATRTFFGLETLSALCLLPLHHVSGLMQLIRAALTGGQLWLGTPREWEVTSTPLPKSWQISLVPTLLERWLGNSVQATRLRNASVIYIGGASASLLLLERAQSAGLPVAPCYGMTETASMIAAVKPQDLPTHGLDATFLPHAQGIVRDGELIVRADSLFRRYLHDTGPPPENWPTGDEARMLPDGRLRVLGRRDRLINTGGEKVDSLEVEKLLLEHPDIIETCVLGLDDKHWGQCVACAYVSRTTATTPEALETWLRDRLSPYKIPRHWQHLPSLLRHANGKLAYDRLRACFDS